MYQVCHERFYFSFAVTLLSSHIFDLEITGQLSTSVSDTPTFVTHLSERNIQIGRPVILNRHGKPYQLRTKRILNFHEDEKLVTTLSTNGCMGVMFFNNTKRSQDVTKNRYDEESFQRDVARYKCQDIRHNPINPYKGFNGDYTITAMKRNSEISSENHYSLEWGWPNIASIAQYGTNHIADYSNVQPALDRHQTINTRRLVITFTDPGHHKKRLSADRGHPYNDDAISRLPKDFGLPCCAKHPGGCGLYLREGMVVKVDASQCILVNHCIWCVPVKVWSGLGFGCTVGFAKIFFDNLDMIGNRLAIVTRINFDDHMYSSQKHEDSVWIGKQCHGVVEAYFLDGVHGGCTGELLYSVVQKEEEEVVKAEVVGTSKGEGKGEGGGAEDDDQDEDFDEDDDEEDEEAEE